MLKKNICKKIHSFHHYPTWFLAPIFVLAPTCFDQLNPTSQAFAIAIDVSFEEGNVFSFEVSMEESYVWFFGQLDPWDSKVPNWNWTCF